MTGQKVFFFGCIIAGVMCIPNNESSASEQRPASKLSRLIAELKSRCIDCHSGDEPEGDVRFDRLNEMSSESKIELLKRAQEQVFFKLMPPLDAEQPTSEERSTLLDSVQAVLRSHDALDLDEKLRYPQYGNYLDHDKLFSGDVSDPGFTPARRWLVSPQIFHERVIDVFNLTDFMRDGFSKRGQRFYGITNPFLLPDHSGVRYYDFSTLDGGHLLVMLDNAKWIARKQIREARVKSGQVGANEFDDSRDRWTPRITPLEFETVILNQTAPSDEELSNAIQRQFELVLQRAADAQELGKYLALTRSAIELSGNTEGLSQMLVAVLLESEFLYRLEFGAGEPDEFGRRMLSPREGSFAISYALGDRGPDAELREAAASGRLESREDYRREVLRLLDDDNYYRGQIDSTLNGKHYRSNETSHPRIIRFFREFFGYAGCLKVFKDFPRSNGYYRNPGRGSQATPGWLTLEADRFVTLHVENDQNVFEKLLTSDEFFVYHDKDNEAGRKIIDEWREVYLHLKDTDWINNPEQVLAENIDFIKERKSMRTNDTSRPGELVNYMHFFEESFGKGRTPFTTIPWAHGYTFHHAPFYSLPPTPSIGRYGSWKSTKYQANVVEREFWDYPVEQPFKIPNRMGILTHPAWLIAHSSNFHTDPIRRGKWIREKLLAGLVPDIPITVDAQVPEDPHKTLRQRVDSVTKASSCWKCHSRMNPLGMAFEIYDDFGRFRDQEPLENEEHLIKRGDGKSTFDVYDTLPVVTTGELSGTGSDALDGPVDGPLDMIERLAKSERVRQSIIRHAFRFFMGRNEMLSDSQTLIDADQAYVDSNGSFKAVIVSLLTSDSFMYRK